MSLSTKKFASENLALNTFSFPLEIRQTEKGEFVFGTKIEKGESTKSFLSSIIPKVIKNLQGPRFMKWGCGSFKFSRPIRWVVSLYNDEILDFGFDECDPKISIGNKSKSHRLINEIIEIHSPDNYFELMANSCLLYTSPSPRD